MYKLADGISFKKIGNQCIIYDSLKNMSYVVNETAGIILEKISMESTSESIVKFLSSHYAIEDLETLQADVTEILDEYIGEGIIQSFNNGENTIL